MKFLGNYKEWLDSNQALVDFVTNNRGWGRPGEDTNTWSTEKAAEIKRSTDVGYSYDQNYWYLFTPINTGMEIDPPDIIPRPFKWWVIKMIPGNFMPMHKDSHVLKHQNDNSKNVNRYWMPLKDWEPGHIFMYEDMVLTNYKAGDLWVYDDSTALHGAANIGHTDRIIMQISSFD